MLVQIGIFAILDAFAGVPTGLIQNPEPNPGVINDSLQERILERFEYFSETEQEAILKRTYRAALEAPHPLAKAAHYLENDPQLAKLPKFQYDAERNFDAATYAPALGLKTKALTNKSSSWKKAHKNFFKVLPLPEHGATWEYDYGRNGLIPPQETLSRKERLRKLMNGQWPDPGRIAALTAATLDHRTNLDPVADYFEHHYRDRSGRVYTGMRLYDVWGSGREIEVSDVESIAYLRNIAHDNRLRSPIPGRYHNRIYAQISKSFEEWRDYRVLVEGLALRLESPQAELSIWFTSIGAQVDEAWALVFHDPPAMRKLLETAATRKEFFQQLERATLNPEGGRDALFERVEERPRVHEIVAHAVHQQLKLEGLLGLGRR